MGKRFGQPQQSNTGEHDPELCFCSLVAWPPELSNAELPAVDHVGTYTDSNWGPQDASHPKPGEIHRLDEVQQILALERDIGTAKRVSWRTLLVVLVSLRG